MAHLCQTHEVGQRRAFAVLNLDRSSVRYVSCRGEDAALRRQIRDTAVERKRFGYRRIHMLLARQDLQVNQKKLRRL